MIIAIYYKDKWQYITHEDGSRCQVSKDRAFKFTEKAGELMAGYLRSLGFKVNVEA